MSENLVPSAGTPAGHNPPQATENAPVAFPVGQASSRVPMGYAHPASAPTTAGQPIVSLRGVTKIYGQGDTEVHALAGISVDFIEGQFTAIMGASGSGKSTMLHILAGLDTPTDGQVAIENIEITHLKDKDLTRLRRDRIGFVFQSFNLVPTLDARANIVLPLELAGKKPDPQWFDSVVHTLGLTQRLTHRPSELSGGQQQRVAVARALVSKPAVIVADEPTGNLDSHASAEVLSLLRKAVDELNQTVIMVTHDRFSAAAADRVLVMRDGQIMQDLAHPTPEQLTEA